MANDCDNDKRPQPNIVFILIDDMGWADLSCYGSDFHETPNLDRLAQQSMRFTDAYAASPVCSPARASILTGKYPARVGITNWIPGCAKGRLLSAPYRHWLPDGERTIAAALRDAGYATWHVGKWHLAGPQSSAGEEHWPQRHGFDCNIGGGSWGSPAMFPDPGYFSPWGLPCMADGPEGEYLTDRLTDEAVRLIENHDGRPFFLNLWYYTVHVPIQAKHEVIEKYRAKAKALELDKKDPFEYGEYFPIEHKKDQRVIRRLFQSDPGYAAMVQSLDENIGRLMAVLDAQGLADDTVVIFTSDNGGLSTAEESPTCNAPLSEGKGWMYEGGTREPLMIRWPGVAQPDSLCDVPVTGPDFYPTLLDIAGADPIPAQHVDGVTLTPLLAGGSKLDREAIFWHYPHYGNQGGTPGCSVRAGRYKLIEFFEDSRVELYDLQEDLSETHDLAAEQPEITERLCAMLHEWLDDVGAKFPQPNPEYQAPDADG